MFDFNAFVSCSLAATLQLRWQLAARYSWIDLSRAGIWGHSGGGAATATAMFTYPDFFKVGISESGNHDNRIYDDSWAERYWGLEVIDAEGKSNYAKHARSELAKNLKGHLLLAHGTMDDNVHPNSTLLLLAALIKANKDFDLIMIPNRPHAYGPDANYVPAGAGITWSATWPRACLRMSTR